MTTDVQMPELIWADQVFWPNVDKSADCWIWTASTLGRGYGAVQPKKGKPRTGAHRFSWALHNGRWPAPGMVIMHSCDNPKCVNPKHLTEGTYRENSHDCVRKGRHVPFRPLPKTHCPSGHPLTDDNVQIVMSRGVECRRCAICHRENHKKWKAKNGSR